MSLGKKFFISLSLVAGVGPTFIRSPEDAQSGNRVEAAVRGIFRSAIGWNSEKHYFGITSVNTDSSQVDIENAYLSRGVNNVKLFYGRRFNTSGFLDKIKDKPF